MIMTNGELVCDQTRRGHLFVCQVKFKLPAQCCGQPADQIFKCEVIAPEGHKCQVGEHTMLHERMGNGHHCSTVEQWIHLHGGLEGWCKSGLTPYHRIGL